MPTYIPGAPRDDAAPPTGPALAPPALPGRRSVTPAAATTETSLPQASAKPAGRAEIQRLAIFARAAWEDCGARAAGVPFDDWRHDQVRMATEGRANGLSDLRRGDWRVVAAHFLGLSGKVRPAFRTAKRAGREDRDEAAHKLREACDEARVMWPDYPAAICRQQYKCGLDEATAKQLWRLFYTVRNRRHVKRPHLPADASETSRHSTVEKTTTTQANRSRGSAGDDSDDIPL